MQITPTAISAALLIGVPTASAELIEMTISGSSAGQSGLLIPGTGTMQEVQADWSLTIIYDSSGSLGTQDLNVVDAWMTIDGDRRKFDPSLTSDDPHAPDAYVASQSVQASSLGPEATFVSWGLVFRLGAGDGTSMFFSSSSMYVTPDPVDADAFANMPVGFALQDLNLPTIVFDAGEGTGTGDSTVWTRGGEWAFYATSFGARVVPAPFGTAVLGVGMLITARRRR